MIKEIFKSNKYIIEINTDTNMYSVSQIIGDDTDFLKEFHSYTDAVEYMKNHEKRQKAKKKVAPLKVLIESWGTVEELTVSSARRTRYGIEIYAHSASNGRRKLFWSDEKYLKDNETNRALLQKVAQLNREINQTKRLLKRYTSKEIMVYFGEEKAE
jgi:hypothetical protein